MRKSLIIILLALSALLVAAEAWVDYFPMPEGEFNPKKYICYRATVPPVIDGRVEDDIWQKTDWSDKFVDIEGDLKPLPFHDTQVKMLWDDHFLYFAAKLYETDVWAKLLKRDSVIFYDNDFEIFIDPDGDTHNYYEFEMNAYNTVWDLLLTAPYRDAENKAVDSWDIQKLMSAVHVNGTINNPEDTDNFWSLEVAIPWQVLEECANRRPEDGDQWRVNFSRVQWDTEIVDYNYKKLEKPEHNWVWSPQGIINMHYPENWGFVQFSENQVGEKQVKFKWNKDEDAKMYLRQIYYQQRDYNLKHGIFTADLQQLALPEFALDNYQPAKLYVNPHGFYAILKSTDNTKEITIDQTGRTRIIK